MSGEDDDWFEEAFEEDRSSGRSDEDDWFEGSGGGAAAATEPADAGAEPFEDDFGSALEGAPGPDDDFAAAFEGEGPEEFDAEAYDLDLSRLEIGIEGLDNMIQGGVPERSLMVAIGAAGTGKPTFGLQFVHHGLEQREQAGSSPWRSPTRA